MRRIHFDGGTRLNSVCLYDEDLDFYDVVKFPTAMTNNQLEYMALLRAVKYADVRYPFLEGVTFVGDSELIIKQMKGEYKVTNEVLNGMYQAVSDEILKIKGSPHDGAMFEWVPRNANRAGVYLERLG